MNLPKPLKEITPVILSFLIKSSGPSVIICSNLNLLLLSDSSNTRQCSYIISELALKPFLLRKSIIYSNNSFASLLGQQVINGISFLLIPGSSLPFFSLRSFITLNNKVNGAFSLAFFLNGLFV